MRRPWRVTLWGINAVIYRRERIYRMRGPSRAYYLKQAMSGNGADIGQALAMLRDVLVIQNETRNEVRAQGRKLDDLAGQVVGLRQAVDDYHAAVVGHGVLIGELDERVTRLEQRGEPTPEAAE